VARFEKDDNAFAVLCKGAKEWGAYGIEGYYEPLFFIDRLIDRDGNLESISWTGGFDSIFVKPLKSDFDSSVLSGARAMREGEEISIADDFFVPSSGKKDVVEPGAYYPKQDVYVIPGPRKADAVIDLGKGVYLLLSNKEVVGLVLKGAKEKYEKARVWKPK
jgi:hypothetical protein